MTLSAFDLTGKVAVVTGGASGIGVGIATLLAEAGAHVVIADRNAEGAQGQAAAMNAAGQRASAVQLDLASEQSIIDVCASIVAQHGTPWILVNNAGIHDREALLDATSAEWDRVHAINARGPFLMIRELARAMVAAGHGGRIVNIASNSVVSPQVIGLASYASAKGALVTLTQVSAFELVEHNITVNVVLPGGVATPGAANARGPAPQGPAKRRPPLGFCEPKDIGAAVLFFASPGAGYITNQTLIVDAGFSVT